MLPFLPSPFLDPNLVVPCKNGAVSPMGRAAPKSASAAYLFQTIKLPGLTSKCINRQRSCRIRRWPLSPTSVASSPGLSQKSKFLNLGVCHNAQLPAGELGASRRNPCGIPTCWIFDRSSRSLSASLPLCRTFFLGKSERRRCACENLFAGTPLISSTSAPSESDCGGKHDTNKLDRAQNHLDESDAEKKYLQEDDKNS